MRHTGPRGKNGRNNCRVCGVTLDENKNWSRRRSQGIICDEHAAERERKRYFSRKAADPEYGRKRWARRRSIEAPKRAAWNAAHPEEIRRRNLWRQYGVTPEQVDLMFAKQGRVCAICGDEPRNGVPSVDHIHGTKIIRGLLCDRCNAGIGMFLDDTHRLYKAMVYLTKAKELVA